MGCVELARCSGEAGGGGEGGGGWRGEGGGERGQGAGEFPCAAVMSGFSGEVNR